MTEHESGYNLTPPEEPPVPPSSSVNPAPKPGDPDFVPPVPIIEKADPESADDSSDAPLEYDPDLDPDVAKNKGLAILGYFVFLIPYLAAPDSKFARYHANQGLLVAILFCSAVVANILLHLVSLLADKVFSGISALTFFFSCIAFVLGPAVILGVTALAIFGIVNAFNGLKNPIPLFGQITLIK